MNPVATQWLAVASPPLAFVVALSLLSWLLGPGRRWMPIDRPNGRSLHSTPTPRSGGVAVIGASLLAALAITPAWPLAGWLAAGAGVLAGVSLIDDFRGLPALLRLLAHLAVAALFLLLAPGAANWPAGWLGMLAVPVAVLALGWAINLYNFMDGADGLSGGMTAIGFSALAAGFLRVGDTGAAALSAAIALAALAFLRYNFHPARIFMGDVGVVPLGFLAGALGAIGIAADYWPFWSRRWPSRPSGSMPRSPWGAGCCGANASGQPTASTTSRDWCAPDGRIGGSRSPSMRRWPSAPQ